MSPSEMRLYYTRYSPFSRKVLLLAQERGLIERIELVPTEVGTHVELDTPAHDLLSKKNPLIKVPTLEVMNLGTMFDSRSICEYLDSLHNEAPVIPRAGPERWQALKLQSLADGIVDAALLLRFEQRRDEDRRWLAWINIQRRRIIQGLEALELDAAFLGDEALIGEISIAAALGYLDFRLPELAWRSHSPTLASWYGRFELRPAMQSTKPN